MALFKCPFCAKKYLNKEALYMHMDTVHHEDLSGLSPKQVYFNYSNKYALTKGFGKSVISGKPTKFNEITGRYERFLPEEKQKYREYFLANMKKAGKENIMKDMDHQKEMLAARHISGKYKFKDGGEVTYTGSYEKKFLEYLDIFLGFPSSDILGPAPQLFPYKDPDDIEHVHIPDFYITSLNLIVNIKSSQNKHYRLRDLEIEKLEDLAIESSKFNYIKIYDNDFERFNKVLDALKDETIDITQRERIFLTERTEIEDNVISELLNE